MFSSVGNELRGLKNYQRDILVCCAIFVAAVYAGYIAAVLLQDRSVEYYAEVRKIIIGSGLPENIFLYILTRNAIVSFTALVLGIVTYNVWPVMILLMNGVISGFAAKMQALLFNHYTFEIWLFGLIPHGIPELGALFIACGSSFYYRRLRSRGKPVWGRVVKTYFSVVLPLLVLAALIETFVTPLIIQRFLQ
ncbi:stage II sporulation protein M [Desulfotruncus alcoholivorax]|uniref:stage II sporulation protein M n=1 Tax=Desulfotruncus alcoholivorax TaxID=265477 RepID=UPI0004135B60|nr:stage II sporulation protein M [Desulfotruncus alcoholivorax]